MKARLFFISFLILLLAVATTFVIAQTTPEPPPTPEGNFVLPQDVFLRGGPGEDFLPVGALVSGDIVRGVGRNEDADWVLIPYRRGFGWIRRDLVFWIIDIDDLPVIDEANLTPSPVPGEETATPFFPTATPSGSYIRLGDANSALVRAGPGQGYLRLGQLFPGDPVEAVGRNENTSWIMIRYEPPPNAEVLGAEFSFGWIRTDLALWTIELSELPVLSEDDLTPTITYTPSITRTPSATDTETPTLTLTLTPSDTATLTSTPTRTSTVTDTATSTPTDEPSSTPEPSETPVPTSTLTLTATDELTNTPEPSETPVPNTATATLTPTDDPTATDEPSSTPEPSETPVPTSTLTLTLTATDEATNTPQPSETPVPETPTATLTPTDEPTSTDEPTATDESTNTPEPSETPVPDTETATLTPTDEPTATETAIPAISTDTPEPTGDSTAEFAALSVSETADARSTQDVLPTMTDTVEPTDQPTLEPTTVEPPATEVTVEETDEVVVEISPEATEDTGVIVPEISTDTPTIIEEVAPEDGDGGGFSFPIEALVGGILLLLILVYVALYLRGIAATERYNSGFIIDRCPVCRAGNLHHDMKVDRVFGIPRPKRIVRCDNCRSVLRETGNGWWRYAVDRLANPMMYERFNGREIDNDTLRMLDKQPIVTTDMPPGQAPPPTFIDGEDQT